MSDPEIPTEAVRLALKEWERVWNSGSYTCSRPEDLVRAALTAALPALRRQWAEQVAQMLTEMAEMAGGDALDVHWAVRDVREFGEGT